MFQPVAIDFNVLQEKMPDIIEIMHKFCINIDSIKIFGLAIGCKMRWVGELDLLVETENGLILQYDNIEICNEQLSALLNISVSVMTADSLNLFMSTDAIKQEAVSLKSIFANLKIFKAIKENDFSYVNNTVVQELNSDYNTLLVSHYGKITMLHYAINVSDFKFANELLNQEGVNPNVKDSRHLTALQCLIRKIDQSKIIDKDIISLLKRLIEEYPVHLNFSDNLYLDKSSNHPEITQLYRQLSASKRKPVNQSINTPHHKLQATDNFEEELIGFLKQHGYAQTNGNNLSIILEHIIDRLKQKKLISKV